MDCLRKSMPLRPPAGGLVGEGVDSNAIPTGINTSDMKPEETVNYEAWAPSVQA